MKNQEPKYFDGRSLPKNMLNLQQPKGTLTITPEMRKVMGANPYTPYLGK